MRAALHAGIEARVVGRTDTEQPPTVSLKRVSSVLGPRGRSSASRHGCRRGSQATEVGRIIAAPASSELTLCLSSVVKKHKHQQPYQDDRGGWMLISTVRSLDGKCMSERRRVDYFMVGGHHIIIDIALPGNGRRSERTTTRGESLLSLCKMSSSLVVRWQMGIPLEIGWQRKINGSSLES